MGCSNTERKERIALPKRVLSLLPDVTDGDIARSRTESEEVERRLGCLVNEGVALSKKRTSDLDATLGFQQLCDIAVRALSPGVNDPYAATSCMDVLTSVLATLATMNIGVPHTRLKMTAFAYVHRGAPTRTCWPR